MKPAIKSGVIWNHLSNLNARMRADGKRIYIPDAIKNDVCAKCDGEAVKFESGVDATEYRMSGMCAKCQDQLYYSIARDNS